MHEYGVVREVLDHVLKELKRRGGPRVQELRLRRGSALEEGALRQAFACVAAGTPLAGATLVLEEFCEFSPCERCGRVHRVAPEALCGDLYVCPVCGATRHVDEAHGLEVLEVVIEEKATA